MPFIESYNIVNDINRTPVSLETSNTDHFSNNFIQFRIESVEMLSPNSKIKQENYLLEKKK